MFLLGTQLSFNEGQQGGLYVMVTGQENGVYRTANRCCGHA